MNNRYEQLDSLRGLAALFVVFHHLFLSFSSNHFLVTFLKLSPARLLVQGHAAVIIFFLLSGFVLALPILRGNPINYMHYIIKRFCRIYIPYAVAISATILISIYISDGQLQQYTDFINQS